MGIKNIFMKTFHSEEFGKVDNVYKDICTHYSKGLELFLKMKNLKNDPDDYDMKTDVSKHAEDIKVYDTYTQNTNSFPDAVWLYTKEHPLNVETAQYVNDNVELFSLTQDFYVATKNTTRGQYHAFGLDEDDRNKVDAELSSRKILLLRYLNVINTTEEEADEKPKVEAYTIDAKENKKSYLDTELNDENDKVFVIDDTTWGEYIAHVNHCMNTQTLIKDDIKLINENKFLIRRCYKEMNYDGGITIKSIYEIKRDSQLKQYVDVCNTAKRFAEEDYALTYKQFVSQGMMKPFDPQMSLIDCLYIVSHIDIFKKMQNTM